MPRTVKVTFEDGSDHTYEGVPDDATPEQVEIRAQRDFAGKRVTALDGGAPPPSPVASAEPLGDVDDRTSRARREYNARLGDPNSQEFKEYFDGAKKAGFRGTAAEFYQQVRDDLAREAQNTNSGNFGAAKLAKAPLEVAEGGLSVLSSLAATPISGLAGLAALPFGGLEKSVDTINSVGSALTYRPRTKGGRSIANLVAAPFEKLAEVGDKAGDAALEATGSPMAAAAVDSAVQLAPALLFRGAKKPAAGAVDTTLAAEAAKLGASPGAVTRAQAYAVEKLQRPWEDLTEGARRQLSRIAEDAKTLEGLSPDAVARQLKFESLPVPVPATRGTLERDPVTMRNEANAAGSEAGQVIYDTNLRANEALIQNLDVLRNKVAGTGKTAATATTAEQAGGAVQGAARAKLNFQKERVKEKYTKADEAGETAALASTKPVEALLADNSNLPYYNYAKTWLEANTKPGNFGQPSVSIRDFEKLRQQAVAELAKGGTDKFYATELIKAIDKSTETAGGKLYKEARAERNKQGLEFEEQAAVAELVENSSRTDRVTALENTTRTILNGSIDDVRKIKRTLLTGGDAATRTAGRQAWREVRVQVIEDIKAQATKSVALNKDGSPNLSPAALKTAIDKYRPKLDELFGAGTVKQLDAILAVARDAKTQPPRLDVGSSTVANALSLLGKAIDKIPVVGSRIVDVTRGVGKLQEIGKDARAAQSATTTPLGDALAEATKRRQRGSFQGRDARLVPLSQVGQKETQ